MHKCDTCKWVRAYTDELFQTRPICLKASTIAAGIRAYNAKECPFVKKVVKQDAERND